MKNEDKVQNSKHYSALCAFIAGVNRKIEDYWKRMDFTFAKPDKVFVHSIGSTYAKLATYRERNGKYEVSSVYCFFNYHNGDLFKGHWKAPVANGKRGNVNDANILSRYTEHGPAYL